MKTGDGKVGDKVRVIKLPPGMPSEINSVFERCVGKVFEIHAIHANGLFELEIGEIDQQPCYMQSIWIEPECVEVL